ncbi:hypothetical protein ACFL35_13695 [Candidatus Riflebacteria bacterium]
MEKFSEYKKFILSKGDNRAITREELLQIFETPNLLEELPHIINFFSTHELSLNLVEPTRSDIDILEETPDPVPAQYINAIKELQDLHEKNGRLQTQDINNVLTQHNVSSVGEEILSILKDNDIPIPIETSDFILPESKYAESPAVDEVFQIPDLPEFSEDGADSSKTDSGDLDTFDGFLEDLVATENIGPTEVKAIIEKYNLGGREKEVFDWLKNQGLYLEDILEEEETEAESQEQIELNPEKKIEENILSQMLTLLPGERKISEEDVDLLLQENHLQEYKEALIQKLKKNHRFEDDFRPETEGKLDFQALIEELLEAEGLDKHSIRKKLVEKNKERYFQAFLDYLKNQGIELQETDDVDSDEGTTEVSTPAFLLEAKEMEVFNIDKYKDKLMSLYKKQGCLYISDLDRIINDPDLMEYTEEIFPWLEQKGIELLEPQHNIEKELEKSPLFTGLMQKAQKNGYILEDDLARLSTSQEKMEILRHLKKKLNQFQIPILKDESENLPSTGTGSNIFLPPPEFIEPELEDESELLFSKSNGAIHDSDFDLQNFLKILKSEFDRYGNISPSSLWPLEKNENRKKYLPEVYEFFKEQKIPYGFVEESKPEEESPQVIFEKILSELKVKSEKQGYITGEEVVEALGDSSKEDISLAELFKKLKEKGIHVKGNEEGEKETIFPEILGQIEEDPEKHPDTHPAPEEPEAALAETETDKQTPLIPEPETDEDIVSEQSQEEETGTVSAEMPGEIPGIVVEPAKGEEKEKTKVPEKDDLQEESKLTTQSDEQDNSEEVVSGIDEVEAKQVEEEEKAKQAEKESKITARPEKKTKGKAKISLPGLSALAGLQSFLKKRIKEISFILLLLLLLPLTCYFFQAEEGKIRFLGKKTTRIVWPLESILIDNRYSYFIKLKPWEARNLKIGDKLGIFSGKFEGSAKITSMKKNNPRQPVLFVNPENIKLQHLIGFKVKKEFKDVPTYEIHPSYFFHSSTGILLKTKNGKTLKPDILKRQNRKNDPIEVYFENPKIIDSLKKNKD